MNGSHTSKQSKIRRDSKMGELKMPERKIVIPVSDENEQIALKRLQNTLDCCSFALDTSREAYNLILRSAVKRVRPDIEVDKYWTHLGSEGKNIGLMLKESD
jgi:hypothetical protein